MDAIISLLSPFNVLSKTHCFTCTKIQLLQYNHQTQFIISNYIIISNKSNNLTKTDDKLIVNQCYYRYTLVTLLSLMLLDLKLLVYGLLLGHNYLLRKSTDH